jgi:nicotinate-nucleotide pyrophosphorylase (carboxylating)
VRCGGGLNHRTGLFDAVLIKDNHLASAAQSAAPRGGRGALAEAVRRARQYIQQHVPEPPAAEMIVEIEVDSLRQLDEVLPAGPDLVLLDNMRPARLRKAVQRRDARNPSVELEASGGVSLKSVRRIAEAGVDRISVGSLTHSAGCLDIGLDWLRSGG